LEHLSAYDKVERIEAELKKALPAELAGKFRDWLDDFVEDGLEFTPEFESTIGNPERRCPC